MKQTTDIVHFFLLNPQLRRYLHISTYADDIYDRWWILFFDTDWTKISTTNNFVNSNDYDLLKAAITTAATPANYPYMHFAEIPELHTDGTKELDMVWNGEVMSDPIISQKLKRNTISSLSPRTCKGTQCSFQLIRTNRSALPPLFNAFEVFTVIQLPQSETKETDGTGNKP